ncbi:MAG TPA: hypothetical protein PLY86_03145, partial [bacterium]|nr:hypothetical protein [bacterium]
MKHGPTSPHLMFSSGRNLSVFRVFSIILFSMALVSTASGGDTLEISLLWTAESKTYLETSAMMADLNGDGLQEGILAGREEFIAIDGTGK